MNNSKGKRHHYVPEMLLKRFVDIDGKLRHFDKRAPLKGVITSSPKNVFLETHLYTFEEKDGTKNARLEESFSQYESKADRIIDKIVTAARKGHRPMLTETERKDWNLFFYYQWKRTPDFLDSIKAIADIDKTYQKVIEKLKSIRPLTEEERISFENPDTKERIKKAAKVTALSDQGPLVQELLNIMGLGIVIVPNPKKSFIIGSNPVLRNIPKGSHLGNPEAEILIPMAHDVLVGPDSMNPNEERIIKISDRKIREFNERIFKQSTGIAGRSKELISSLARIRRLERI